MEEGSYFRSTFQTETFHLRTTLTCLPSFSSPFSSTWNLLHCPILTDLNSDFKLRSKGYTFKVVLFFFAYPPTLLFLFLLFQTDEILGKGESQLLEHYLLVEIHFDSQKSSSFLDPRISTFYFLNLSEISKWMRLSNPWKEKKESVWRKIRGWKAFVCEQDNWNITFCTSALSI